MILDKRHVSRCEMCLLILSKLGFSVNVSEFFSFPHVKHKLFIEVLEPFCTQAFQDVMEPALGVDIMRTVSIEPCVSSDIASV